ncbi:MAG: efflux RND transporter periplasmic adaptor subunit, partial [Candidatus Eisenbacteria sp.]|nr:efflux RND transporter periplasmic adaptor subunit [Candidatus Eisenbacteria bacterium]
SLMRFNRARKLVFLLIPLLAAILVGCGEPEKAEEEQTAVPVEVAVVRLDDLNECAILTGILDAYRAVDIVSEVTGTIESLHKDVGDRVNRRAILAIVEKDVPRENLRQAEASLMAARARNAVAHSDYGRDSTLYAAGDISESAFEIGRMNWQAALAEVKACTATLRLAERELRETEIRAPFAGYITRRQAEEGMFVSAGKPIFRLVDIDSLRLSLGISQRNIARVLPGKDVLVEVKALEDQVFRGYVRRMCPEADETTLTFAVEAVLENPPDHPLKDGMVVRATLTLEKLTNVIAVARETILRQAGREFVYVVEGGTAHSRDVRTGRMIGNVTIIKEGLVPGDSLVNIGMENLREGSQVVIESSSTPTSAQDRKGDAS